MDITPRVTGRTSALFATAKSNPKLAAALSSIDGVDQTTKLMADLVEEAKSLTVSTTFADVDTAILNSLTAGTGMPADTIDRYGRAAAAAEAYEVTDGALRDLYSSLLRNRDNLVEGGLDAICTRLDSEIKTTFAATQKLGSVPTNAEQAIAEGKTSAYRRLSELRSEYFQIRAAHRALLVGGLTRDDERFHHLSKGWPIIAHAASLGAIWPDLPEWRKYGKKYGANGRLVKLTPPWPDPDSEPFLDWLLAHPNANVWVPTFDQATELLNQINASASVLHDTPSAAREALNGERELHERRQKQWGRLLPHLAG